MKDVRKMKHPSEEELILHYYAEVGGPPRAVIMEHLAVCEPCRTRYRKLQAVLAAADLVEAPAPSEDFEDEIWRRLVPRLAAGESLWQRFFASPGARRIWAPVVAGVAVAALMAGAFLAGRFWPGRSQPQREAQARPVSPQSRERISAL